MRRRAVLMCAAAPVSLKHNDLLFAWTNNYRCVHGVRALEPHPAAFRHCEWKTRALYEHDLKWPYHDLPGDPLAAQVDRSGVSRTVYGAVENLSYQAPLEMDDLRVTMRCFRSLIDSTGHYNAMVDSKHSHLDVGVYRGQDGSMYIAQLFLYPAMVKEATPTGDTTSEVRVR